MKALVTGATGFVGHYLVDQLLVRGHQVRALCRRTAPELLARGVEIAPGDLRDREAVVRACRDRDTVFHAGACTGIWGKWDVYHAINAVGTLHVLEGCRVHGVRRLVYTSSPSVTYDARDQLGVNESVPYARRWLCHYAHSKAIAERAVLAANGESGLLSCAMRPHLVWGPGDPHLIPRLIARGRCGRLRRVGDGTNRIDIAYVENVAAAHVQAAEALKPGARVAGRAYFISQGEPVNCWEWINEVLALASVPPVCKSIPLGVARALGAGLEAIWRTLRLSGEPPMTRFLALQLGTSHYFDISRAREDFGYRPEVSTAEGLRRLGAALASG